MSITYRNLSCRNHICKKICDIFGVHDFSILFPYLFLKKYRGSNLVGFEMHIEDFKNIFNVNDIMAVINMKTDSLIQRISENPEIKSIVFNVSKEDLTKSVLENSTSLPVNKSHHRRKNILVEFSSPNIAKPFHVGHLRSTIVGNYVANILEKSHNVKRLNYLGDWGTQIGFVKAGLEESNISDVNSFENPMKELYNAYSLANRDPATLHKAREIFSSLEKGTSGDWHKEWEKIRILTIKHLTNTYKEFGITFDEYSFESNYRAEKISSVTDILNKNQLTSHKDDCLVLNTDGKEVPLFKSDGTTLYLVRDIAAALDRIGRFQCDSMMYVVDKSQAEHLNNLKYAITKLTNKDIIQHVQFGRITGMSTRKGTSVFLDDILNETINKMAQQQHKSPNTRTSDPEVTKVLGTTALMIYILKQRRNRDFNFSWENAMQGTGDSGVKLQYTHCRLQSLEKNNEIELPQAVDPSALKEDITFELIYELARYEEVLRDSQEHLESSVLVIYLFKLCNLVSRCLKNLPVKGSDHDLAAQRLLLFNSSKNTIASVMKTLGLQPLNEM